METEKRVVWLALNAKYTHTSLAVRYLREACRPIAAAEILELTINNQLLEILGEIYERRPAVLGIACYIWNIELVHQLLPLLARVLPDTAILCGGPEVSYETEAFMEEFPQVDFVLRGEGEEAVRALLPRILQLGRRASAAGIPGVAWRPAAGSLELGQAVTVAEAEYVPFAYREEEMPALREKILYYETSRGCPFSCAYCLSCATRGVRYLPLERVFAELTFFIRQDVRQVKFVDRTFKASKAHFLPILRFLLAQDCRTNFHFEIAVDYLDDEVLEVLSRMPRGRIQLEIGIQSTNPRTLEKVSRVNHWDRIAGNITRLLSFHNMHLHVDLIIGLPEEGIESFARSFNEVYALQPDMLQLGFLKFLKGAAMMAQVESGDYEYMDMAPYEVLASRWLSYGEMRWLKSFEAVFEYYYNAGRCRRTAAYFIREAEQGDAFCFYQRFTVFWEARGYHRRGHAAKNLYGYLADFCREAYGASAELMDNLLRLDALLADGGRIRPEALDWNRERYQPQTAAFWRGERVQSYLPGFVFTNWRELRGKYHIEIFDWQVLAGTAGEICPGRQAVLFDFTMPEVHCREIELGEDQVHAV